MTPKPKYEKPLAMELGSLKPVHGAVCASGNLASDGCGIGNDPQVIPYCNTTGNIATGNCWAAGNTAGQLCYPGSAPSPGLCVAGSAP